MIIEDKYNQHCRIFGSLTKGMQRLFTVALATGRSDVRFWSHDHGKWRNAGAGMKPSGIGIYQFKRPKKVYIHVRGGVAYCDRVPKGVEVKIIDHDNQGG